MPRLVILLSADALIHASVFWCWSARAFMALHDKFDIVAQTISCFLLPSNASMLVNHFDMVVRTPQDFVAIYAQYSGTLIERNIADGSAARKGQTLLTIADLSRVWIEAEVFEADLELVQVGMAAVLKHDRNKPTTARLSGR